MFRLSRNKAVRQYTTFMCATNSSSYQQGTHVICIEKALKIDTNIKGRIESPIAQIPLHNQAMPTGVVGLPSHRWRTKSTFLFLI